MNSLELLCIFSSGNHLFSVILFILFKLSNTFLNPFLYIINTRNVNERFLRKDRRYDKSIDSDKEKEKESEKPLSYCLCHFVHFVSMDGKNFSYRKRKRKRYKKCKENQEI